MAFKQEHPGVWYDRAAVGDAVFKVVFRDHSDSVKTVTADGVRRMVPLAEAMNLVASSAVEAPVFCETRKRSGDICGRELPCRYH